MSVAKPDKDSDEKRFNETLKRMLKTPPRPHSDNHPAPSNRKVAPREQGPQKKTDKEHE